MHCKHKTTKRNYVFFGFSHTPFCHCASFSKPRKYMPIPKPGPERAAWCVSLCKCTHSGAHTFITFISGSDITLLLLFCVYLELIGALACIRNLKLTVLGFTDKGWKEGEAAEQYCLPLQSRTPPLLFSRYTPPLSSRLIKKCNHSFSFKATSGRFLRKKRVFLCLSCTFTWGFSLSLLFHNGPLAIIRTWWTLFNNQGNMWSWVWLWCSCILQALRRWRLFVFERKVPCVCSRCVFCMLSGGT